MGLRTGTSVKTFLFLLETASESMLFLKNQTRSLPHSRKCGMTVNEPHPTQTFLNELVGRLNLTVGEADKAYGEIQGSPVTMSVLGAEPPALLFGFKIRHPHPADISLPVELKPLIDQKIADFSLEKSIAWLSLDDLSGETSESVEGLVTGVAEAIAVANLRVPPGCLRCQSEVEPVVVYGNGSLTRLCAGCREQVVEDTIQRQAELDRPSLMFFLALPLLCLYVSLGWTILWWLVDVCMEANNANVIFIDNYSLMLIGALICVTGAVLGYPIGRVMARSGTASRFRAVISTLVVFFACGIGEWFYLTLTIYRRTGIVDFVYAADALGPFIANSHFSWIMGKLCFAIAVAVGCNYGSQFRRIATLKL